MPTVEELYLISSFELDQVVDSIAYTGCKLLPACARAQLGRPLCWSPEQFKFFVVSSQSFLESNDASISRVRTYLWDTIQWKLGPSYGTSWDPPDAALDDLKVG
jgi:hypothetical protein